MIEIYINRNTYLIYFYHKNISNIFLSISLRNIFQKKKIESSILQKKKKRIDTIPHTIKNNLSIKLFYKSIQKKISSISKFIFQSNFTYI